MLNLQLDTSDDWADRVAPWLDELLVEQAHLEKKAASAALSYVFRYPDHVELHAPLSELAREELEHFELVLALLSRRGLRFGRQVAGPYAEQLLRLVRPDEPERLLDRLLCNAAIEARSCERMRLLARALHGRVDDVASFYDEVVGSEARHHDLYVRLAERYFAADVVATRLGEVMAWEADVVRSAPPIARLHAAGPETVTAAATR